MSSPAPSMLDNLTLEHHSGNSRPRIARRHLRRAARAARTRNEVGDDKPYAHGARSVARRPLGFANLGNGDGHYWGAVQAIKKPTLLEICGPLFMSHPVANNLQYRLSEEQGGTLIKFHHNGLACLVEADRNVKDGWKYIHERVVRRAEAGRKH